jgi:hypothetical protein
MKRQLQPPTSLLPLDICWKTTNIVWSKASTRGGNWIVLPIDNGQPPLFPGKTGGGGQMRSGLLGGYHHREDGPLRGGYQASHAPHYHLAILGPQPKTGCGPYHRLQK